MPQSTPEVRTEGDLTVIEAPTAEAALGEVAATVGPHAQIVSVEKVLRGGIGGFFAREVVQIKARTAGSAPTPDPVTPERAASAAEAKPTGEAPPVGEGNALQRMLARLTEETGDTEQTFADTLRQQMGVPSRESVRPKDLDLPSEPAAAAVGADAPAAQQAAGGRVLTQARTQTAPAAAPATADGTATAPATAGTAEVAAERRPAPASENEARAAVLRALAAKTPPAEPQHVAVRPAAGASPVQWSVENLRRRGMPALVIDAVADLDPRDDLAWVHAIGRAVATLCRPLPGGDAILVGPKARTLAEALDAPCVKPPTGRGRKSDLTSVPRKGSFCAPLSHSEHNRSWIGWARGDRWLHLVIGGAGWRDLVFDEPLAVSWVDDGLPEAIALCADLGLVLGYGPGGDQRAERATPVDVAMAIRAMMPRS
jgi:hypothetical protein